MDKKYFVVKLRYAGLVGKVGGWHIIKAHSKEDALRIREKFGISYPMNAPDTIVRSCELLDLDQPWIKNMLFHRKKGYGGSIWYEDENGQLQKETE